MAGPGLLPKRRTYEQFAPGDAPNPYGLSTQERPLGIMHPSYRAPQARLSEQFKPPGLQTNQQSLLAGTTPNVTASPGFAPQPQGPGAPPVTQQLGKPATAPVVAQSAAPQHFGEDGRPMPGTLDSRVAAAKARLPGRPAPASVADRLTPPGAPSTTGEPLLRTPPPLAHEGPPAKPSILDLLKPDAPPPVPTSEPTYTKFNPTPSPVTPAPVLGGPMTSPEDIAANKARRADSLAERAFGAQARGIGRGVERDVRLDARRAGVPYGAMAGHRMDQQRLSDQFALKSRELGIDEQDIASKERIEGGRTGADKYKTDAVARTAGDTNASMERRTETEGKYGVETAKARAEGDRATRGDADKEQILAAEESGLREQLKSMRDSGAPKEQIDELEDRLKQAQTKRGIKPYAPPPKSTDSDVTRASNALLPAKAEEIASKAGFDLAGAGKAIKSHMGVHPFETGRYEEGGKIKAAPLSVGGAVRGAYISPFQQAFGGAGDDPYRNAAMLADKLHLMQSKSPAAFRIGIKPLQTAWQQNRDAGWEDFIDKDLPKKMPATAKFFKALAQGEHPDEATMKESQVEIRKVPYLNKAQ